MSKVAAGLVGIVTAALLFPFGGTTQCADGTEGGGCTSWTESFLVRYSGENGAVGMAIAVAAGLAAALVVFFISQRLGPRRNHAPGGEPHAS